jgi:hypothetical protein
MHRYPMSAVWPRKPRFRIDDQRTLVDKVPRKSRSNNTASSNAETGSVRQAAAGLSKLAPTVPAAYRA